MLSSPRLLKSSSSNRWLARQARDPFVRQRTSSNSNSSVTSSNNTVTPAYRARSSFKLSALAEKYPALLSRARTVVDLGAAPGGWSQVAANVVSRRNRGTRSGTVVALDILPMDPIPGVDFVQGDFFSVEVRESVLALLRVQESQKPQRTEESKQSTIDIPSPSTSLGSAPHADTVLSDMMAPMTGVRVRDVQASLDLVSAATYFARGVLRPRKPTAGSDDSPGGNLVLKFFLHPDLLAFRKTELDPHFERVVTEKPKASRSESSEAYWVCLGYLGGDHHPDA